MKLKPNLKKLLKTKLKLKKNKRKIKPQLKILKNKNNLNKLQLLSLHFPNLNHNKSPNNKKRLKDKRMFLMNKTFNQKLPMQLKLSHMFNQSQHYKPKPYHKILKLNQNLKSNKLNNKQLFNKLYLKLKLNKLNLKLKSKKINLKLKFNKKNLKFKFIKFKNLLKLNNKKQFPFK